jgi:broad specificity phosphatase PhoE
VLRDLIPDPASVMFVASPLSRASDTMRIARSEMGLDPEDFRRDERLKELNFGALEGQPWIGDQLAVDPTLFPARGRDPFGWRPQDGESYADLTQRLEAWLATLAGPTVVVSHGGVMRALRGHLLAMEKHGIPNLSTPQDQVLIVTRGHERWV